tara:strand:+ start:1568 stop:7696 length:6129 start_codon:yes stop_codon:yes gene_type:complete
MPEIKNSFVKGRMNLDLDKRIIPSGEYTEAFNVQVSTSEDSDVGSVQNILGNEKLTSFLENVTDTNLICIGSISDEKKNRFYWLVVISDDDGVDIASAIIEHNVDLNNTTPIIIDGDNSRLEFNSNNYITGINVVDDFLFFTDGVTEPKKINIEHFRQNAHTDLVDANNNIITSNFYVNNINTGNRFTKEDITVIKRKPTKPPVLELETSVLYGQSIDPNRSVYVAPFSFLGYGYGSTASNPIIKFILPNDVIVQSGNQYLDPSTNLPADYTTFSNLPASTGSTTYNTSAPSGVAHDIQDAVLGVPFSIGQIILMSDSNSPGSLPTNAQIRMEVVNITYQGGNYISGSAINEEVYADVEFEIISIDPLLSPTELIFNWSFENEQDILYETQFARFAYRYKYQDGEYSAFGPFSEVAFAAGPFNIHPTREPYNTGMENRVTKIILKDFVTYDIPLEVVEIDLLYKREDSNVIYSLDTIKPTNADGSNNIAWHNINSSNANIILPSGTITPASDRGYYEITKDLVYSAIPENQFLRPWDNVPKKAKAQDFTAGRLIYGNYTQNINLKPADYSSMRIVLENRGFHQGDYASFITGEKSIKSQRTYQVGISFLDLYGRETPVFTSSESNSYNVNYNWNNGPNGNASRSNRLAVQNIPQIEHVYQTVTVTGVEHSNGTVGQYFFFEINDMNDLLSQEYDNFSIHDIKQYRPTANPSGGVVNILIYEGPVRIWNQQSANSGSASPSGGVTKGHGRYEPFSSSSVNDWQEGDIISIETDAKFFKIFVKETASEYYNLVLDRVYVAEEDGNLWLSFPSSDRNKIKEDDFIILKKTIDSNDQVDDENKFKIIDIKNEAPQFIKTKHRSLGILDGGGNLTGTNGLFPDINNQPTPESNKIIINKQSFVDEDVNDIKDVFDSGKEISIEFQKTTATTTLISRRYRIVSLEDLSASLSLDQYRIVIDRPIFIQDGWIETSTSVLDPALKTKFSVQENKDLQEFQGRFFVKIKSDIITSQYLINQPITSVLQSIIDSSTQIFSLMNPDLFLGQNPTPGSPPVQPSLPNTSDASDTQSDWQTNLDFNGNAQNNGGVNSGWFIDGAYMAAQQPTVSSNIGLYAGMGTPSSNPGATGLLYDVSCSGNLMNNYFGPVYPLSAGFVSSGWIHSSYGSGLASSTPDTTVTLADGGWVDGLQGIINANFEHNNTSGGGQVNGARAWKSQLGTYGDVGEQVYGPQGTTGHYLHLSFSGVGVALHDGSDLNGNDNFPPVSWYDSNASTADDWEPSAKINLQSIENYNTQAAPEHKVCNVEQTGSASGGFDVNKIKYQWTPYGDASIGNYNQGNKDLVDNLVPGNKFRFANDASETEFTILNVTEKRIYNHTAWNRKTAWSTQGGPGSATSGVIEDTSTVHYAWHKFVAASIDGNGPDTDAAFNNLAVALKKFGSPDNRRVCYILELDQSPEDLLNNPENLGGPSSTVEFTDIEFVQPFFENGLNPVSNNPAIFETEPKENLDLDIFYEASQAYPMQLDLSTQSSIDNRKGYLIASIGDKARSSKVPANTSVYASQSQPIYIDCRVKSWDGNIVELDLGLFTIDTLPNGSSAATSGAQGLTDQTAIFEGSFIEFHKEDGSYAKMQVVEVEEITTGVAAIPGSNTTFNLITKLKLDPKVGKVGLSYYNCYSFGNGVESNRIRDDFNRVFIKNGVKASTTLQEQYKQDVRGSGLIFSGIYNKNTSLNDLNQFIMAEKITKELEPTYGSIQKLFARDSDLIALCQDKIVQIAADKDIIFNADGRPQLTASNKVLGQSRPFVGEYGISNNPESFASSSYRAYFTDKQRGAVLRLSMDGLTPISSAGMKDFFKDKLEGDYFNILGTYDSNKDNYNLTFDNGASEDGSGNFSFNIDNDGENSDFKSTDTDVTVTYKENVKGWESFKGFIPEAGLSCANDYFTIRNGQIYKHTDTMRSFFYNTQQGSFVTTVFNNAPTTVKHFNTLNYDGEQGWRCDFIETDLNTGTTLHDFLNKENKWFSTIIDDGTSNVVSNNSFSFQGIGVASNIEYNI